MNVYDYLGEGAANGKHLKHLAYLMDVDTRTLRVMIANERKRGIPILSDNTNGYFMPANRHERDNCVRSLRHRAKEIMAAADGIEKAANKEE